MGPLRLSRVLAAIAAMIMSLSLFAGPREYAQAAYTNGDYASAIRLWGDLAEQGDPASQYNLGLMYATGTGITIDPAKAVEWFRKAADQGLAAAQFELGAHYGNGSGVPKDDAQAVEWLRKAANQGNVDAYKALGTMYFFGRGVPQDQKLAVSWLRKAADQGHAEAQVDLGAAYENGWGVSKDLSEAVNWYRKAADQGNQKAQKFLGDMYANGLGVPKDVFEAGKWYGLSAKPRGTRALKIARVEAASARTTPAEHENKTTDDLTARVAQKWTAVEQSAAVETQSQSQSQKVRLLEVERKKGVAAPGHPATATLLIFDVVTEGMPRDMSYSLWQWVVGKSPHPEVTGLAIDESGRVICLPDAKVIDSGVPSCDPKEPFQVALDAARGEPKRIALVSHDGDVIAMGRLVPFPIESRSGACHLSIELLDAQTFRATGDGFDPNEEVEITDRSDTEVIRVAQKVRANGRIEAKLLPAVKGKDGGTASWSVKARSCTVALDYQWGKPALELQ